jgi:hypothetical protein
MVVRPKVTNLYCRHAAFASIFEFVPKIAATPRGLVAGTIQGRQAVAAFRLRLNLNSALFLLSAVSAWLVTNSAVAAVTACPAGLVCSYVAVQPIDVCASNGTGCAPFNTLSKAGNPGAATSTTPIGFVDTATGKDVTRAIWNQVGIDVAWSPIHQYNNTTYQTLHITNASNGTGLASADFLALSQQDGISQGTAPNPNPPNAPVASQATVVNMFFVNTLVPPTPGTLYGFSWINNNGIAIGPNTFFPPFPLTPRFDTLAHEIGHNLALDHTDVYNTGTPKNDLLTAGVTRTEPGNSSAAIADANATPTSPAEQVNTAQSGHVDLSGLLNPIASSTTTATKTPTPTTTTALAVTTAGGLTSIAAVPGKTKPNTSIFFDVFGPTNGRHDETLIGLTLTLYPGVKFDPSNKVHFTSNGQLVTDADYDRGGSRDRDCPIARTKCLIIDLTNPGLPQLQDLRFSQGIIKSGDGDDENAPKTADDGGKQPVCLADLAAAGITITYRFSDGLVITSAMTGAGGTVGPNCAGDPTLLTADSRQPTLTVRTQIDPGVFTQVAGAKPCTPPEEGTCTPPSVTGGQDGDPSQEAQPGGG